jgi:hypothetical protein
MMLRKEDQLHKWKFKMRPQLIRRISDRSIVYMNELSNVRDENFVKLVLGALCRQISSFADVFGRIVTLGASN